MKDLVSLAEKGSLEAFKSCLSEQPPLPRELFSALRSALLWDQPEKTALLLETGANPLEENEEKDQLLTHAAVGGNPHLVKRMLSLGCDPNHRNIYDRTPLHHAARSGNTEAMQTLMAAGAEPNSSDARNATPLFEALTNNHPQAAILLIHWGAPIDDGDLPMAQTPLMLATKSKSVELVRLLLEKGAHIEARDSNGWTPLIHAVQSGNLEVVKILLDTGADVKAVDNRGQAVFEWASPLFPEISDLILAGSSFSKTRAFSALLKAARDGHIQAIHKLLAQKTPIQQPDEGGDSALWNVTLQKSLHAFETILRHSGGNINYRCGRLLKTPLMMAARTGDVAKATLLLKAGANPAITDADGRNALHYAAAWAQVPVLRLFKKEGADLLSTAPGERSLLHVAIDDTEARATVQDRAGIVEWLLSKGLNPDAADTLGRTPIMLAAYKAYAEIVRLLLDGGADISLTDKDRRSALCHAMYAGTEYGYNERFVRPKTKAADEAATVITLLLEAGADPMDEEILQTASRYRWPGAVKLLTKKWDRSLYSRKKPGNSGKEK